MKNNSVYNPETGLTRTEFFDGTTSLRIEYRNSKGQLHNPDAPAIMWADGTAFWYWDGLMHRVGGPAVVRANGTKEYWVNNLRHRTDGPAVVYYDGGAEYWHLGNFCSPLNLKDGESIVTIGGKYCVMRPS